MKTESGAATQTFNIVNRTLGRGGTFNVATNRTFRVGDVIDFNFNITQQSPNGSSFRFGIANSSGTFVQSRQERITTLGYVGQSVIFKMKIEHAGTYNIRIANTDTTSGSITVNGSCIHRPRISHNAAIRYDPSFRNFCVAEGWNTDVVVVNHLRTATARFDEFAIFFTNGSPTFLAGLSGAQCDVNLSGICNTLPSLLGGCGLVLNCNTEHHRSAERLIKIGGGTTSFTIRMVAHGLCRNPSGISHSSLAGLGSAPGGRESIVTNTGGWAIQLNIQHELSHNIGVRGHCNSAVVWCVMNENPSRTRINDWCGSCSNQILTHRG
jgi:hypothetical protein